MLTRKVLTKAQRFQTAIDVLNDGGYFVWYVSGTFGYRVCRTFELRDKDDQRVPGIAEATFRELKRGPRWIRFERRQPHREETRFYLAKEI